MKCIFAKVALDAVRQLRGTKGDQELLIIVIDAGTIEKAFNVKEKHFERMP
jgi:hypothetical protein